MKVAVVVKYYPPIERVSGIIGLLTVLNRALSRSADVHVVTSRAGTSAPATLSLDGYQIHRVAGPFPVAAAAKVRQLRVDATIFVSGIHETRLAPPYVGAFGLLAPTSGTNVFLQATQLDAVPGPMFERATSWADHVLAASDQVGATLEARLSSDVMVLRPAVDIPALCARPESGPLTVGFINHFNPVKGVGIAIEAVKAVLDKHPGARAILAGAGPDASLVTDAFGRNPRVELHGFVPEAERLEMIARVDIMVLPFATGVSVLGVSQTVLEAMARGNVVVGTPTEAITGAITHNENGLLAPQQHIVDEVVRCADQTDLRQRLGNRARSDAESYWNVNDRVGQLTELIGT